MELGTTNTTSTTTTTIMEAPKVTRKATGILVYGTAIGAFFLIVTMAIYATIKTDLID